MDEQISVAVIGLGIMGRRMLEALKSHDIFYASHMWDPSAEAVAKAREVSPKTEIGASAEEIIERADIVYLACPPEPRRQYAMMAADCGKPIFLEKPLGVDLPTSRAMVSHIRKTGVPAAVNFVQATGEPLRHVQQAMVDGEMGALLGIDIELRYAAWPRAWQKDAAWLNFRQEGGMTREVISHFVFFAERLLGHTRLVWQHAHFPQPQLAEDRLSAELLNSDGIALRVNARVGGAGEDQQTIVIRGGHLSFEVRQFSELWVSDGGAFKQIIVPSANARIDGLHEQLNAFAKCMRGEPQTLATLEEALSVQEKIEGMLAE
jgi:predicted dehydrogenase